MGGKCLSGFQLKWIAIITMTIDHIGVVLFPQRLWLRMIGRLAFPIFCFLIAEGCVHTRNRKAYMLRLFVFAILSEIPYNLAIEHSVIARPSVNIFFTLCIGVATITVLENLTLEWQRIATIGVLIVAMEFLGIQFDYGSAGVLLLVGLYYYRASFMGMLGVLCAVNIFLFGGVQCLAILAIIPISLYNGKRGFPMKHFFYGYYPVHFLVLWAISSWLQVGV